MAEKVIIKDPELRQGEFEGEYLIPKELQDLDAFKNVNSILCANDEDALKYFKYLIRKHTK